MPKSSRPNFLLFITDQHRADFLGCYGHPVLRTPHIDSIAAKGTAFDRFHVASPVCQPNRASLMTARIGKSHLQNFTDWDPLVKRPAPRPGFHEPAKPLTQSLRDHLDDPKYGQETPKYWAKGGAHVRTPFYGFDHVTLVRAHGDDPGGDYDRWLDERDPKARALLGVENGLPHDYTVPQANRTAIPEHLYATAFLGDRAEAYLNDAAPGAPFFLMVSF